MTLYQVINVVSAERQLPEEFWLFCHLLEWTGATRSGIWQYYEKLPDDTFRRMRQDLEQFGLSEIGERYRLGKSAWSESNHAASLDAWLDAHEQQIEQAAFNLIKPHSDYLKQ